MVWRNTTKWLLDLKHQQQDTIFSVWSPVQMRNRANGTRVNGDPTVLHHLKKIKTTGKVLFFFLFFFKFSKDAERPHIIMNAF